MKRTVHGLPYLEPWEIKQDERNAILSQAWSREKCNDVPKYHTVSEDGDFMDIPDDAAARLVAADVIYPCATCIEYHINTGDGFTWKDVDAEVKK
jgi:hypothetical protein